LNESESTSADAEVLEEEPAAVVPTAETAEEAVAEAPAAEAEAPAEPEPAVEEPVAEAPAEDASVAESADAPAEEPAAVEPAAVEPAAEAAPAPQSGPKQKRKRLPRSQRPQKTRPKRVASEERKPIVRLEKPEHERGRRQERQGTVVSDAMEKTIVVKVELVKAHPRYKKVVRRSVKFHAHDEESTAKLGDIVRIVETRPLSKTKRWRLAEVVEAAK
jgi:small subunit ribosomal protein S17